MHDVNQLAAEIAGKLCIPFRPEEKHLCIGRVTFSGPDMKPLIVDVTDKNRLSRLLTLFLLGKPSSVSIDDEMRQKAIAFYGAELLQDALVNPGKHPYIDGFRDYQHIHAEPNIEFERYAGYRDLIDQAWEVRSEINPKSRMEKELVRHVFELLDEGKIRVAQKIGGSWEVHQWIKKAVLLSFKVSDNIMTGGGWWDKVPLKFAKWKTDQFTEAGFRAVPGSVVRRGAHIGKNVILMPSFVNIGAYVDDGTMVDTWATIGSCAQIGKNCHISGGVGVGGVLEPLQANPTIIEDECFIGARSEVVEGVVVRRRAVLSMGTFIGKNTPIVDRTQDNKVTRGEVPENAVVMMGVHPENGLICPQIVKYRDEGTDAATELNNFLR